VRDWNPAKLVREECDGRQTLGSKHINPYGLFQDMNTRLAIEMAEAAGQ
jgi:hypothetical protein